jgi:hypothetical protein
MRTIGLRLIPGDIVDECMEAVIETQRNADAEDPDAAKRKLFDAFGQLGVRAEQIKEYLGHDAATLAPKELTELRALYAAIRDGEATWRDVMDTKEGAAAEAKNGDGKATTLKDIAAKADKKKTAAGPNYATLADRLNKAADKDAADVILDEGRGLPADQYEGLAAIHAERFPA